jgi:hypothetical protein
MRQSSKTVLVLALGSLLVLGNGGAFFYATNDRAIGSVVWPLLAIVLLAGVALLFTVHAYVRPLLDERPNAEA